MHPVFLALWSLTLAGGLVPVLASERPAPVAESERGALTVHVVDSAGRAISGSSVVLETLEDPAKEPLAGTTADAGIVDYSSLPPARYRVTAAAEGKVPGALSPVLVAPGGKGRVQLVLPEACSLAAAIEGPDGEPAAEAEACLRWNDSARDASGAPPRTIDDGRVCETSDSRGRVKFEPLACGTYAVLVRSRALEPLRTELRLSRAGMSTKWRLRSGGAIGGRIVDAEEKPVAGARVRFVDRLRAGTGDLPPIEAETDDAGRFRAAGLPPGTWRVEVRARGFRSIVRDGILVREGEEAALRGLTLDSGLSLSGRVVTDDGEPLPETEVRAHARSTDRRALAKAISDERGRFVLEGLADDPVDLYAVPEGRPPRVALEGIRPPETGLRLEVERGGSIPGFVRARRGGLPSRVLVRAAYETARRTKDWVETDEIDPRTGEFRLAGVPAGGAVTVVALAQGYWSQPVVVEVESGRETDPVDLLLERGYACEGDVRDLEGVPIPGARVAIRAPSTGATAALSFSDLDGSFVLEGAPPGTNTVKAEHSDFATTAREVAFPLADGERVGLSLGRGGVIAGTVRTVDGAPVNGVTIAVRGLSRSASTDASGEYRFERVPAGSHRIVRGQQLGYDDYEQRDIEVTEGGTVIADFTLGRVLEGLVTRRGLPVAGATLTLARPARWGGGRPVFDLAAQRTQTDASGSYRLGGVRSGVATLAVVDGTQTVYRAVVVPEGTSPRLDVRLPSRPVRGLVIDDGDEAPVPRALISADLDTTPDAGVRAGWSSFMSTDIDGVESATLAVTLRNEVRTSTDAAGTFRVFVEPDTESLFASGSGRRGVRVPLERTGEPLVIRLALTAVRRVRVRDAEGRPVPAGWACFLEHRDGSSMRSCSQFDGRGVFDLTEGTYTLVAGGAGHAIRMLRDLEVSADEGTDEEIIVTLVRGVPVQARWQGGGSGDPKIVSLTDARGQELEEYLERNRRGVRDPVTGDVLWRIRPIEPGRWTLTVDPGNGELIAKSVDVELGPPVEVVFP